jgi:hypothetical protein
MKLYSNFSQAKKELFNGDIYRVVYFHDVWGNEVDGYELHSTTDCGYIVIGEESANDLCKFVCSNFKVFGEVVIEEYDSNYTFTEKYSNYPICNFELIDELDYWAHK